MLWLFVGVTDQRMNAKKQTLEEVTRVTWLTARLEDIATFGMTSTLTSRIICGSLMTTG